MTFLDRLRFRWSCIVAYAKLKAPQAREAPTLDDRLAEMEREATAECLTTLFEELPLEKEEQ